MKILFLSNSIQELNGWSIFSKGLYDEIIKSEKIFLFTSDSPAILSLKSNSLITFKLFNKYGLLSSLIDALKILYLTRNQKFDLIHVSVEPFSFIAYLLSFFLRIPYTISVAGTYGVVLPKNHWFFKLSFNKSNKIIALSNYTKNKILEVTPKAKITVINPGVDKSIFYPNHSTKKNQIIFVGNFKERKGFEVLLKSLVELKKIFSDFNLLIITSDDLKYHPNFLNQLNLKKIKYEVKTNVNNETLRLHYSESKVNVLISQEVENNFEGFGLIHYESIACGTLTIGALDSGNEDAVKNPNGYLINCKDYKELSAILFNILNTKNYPILNIKDVKEWKETGFEYLKLFKSIKNQI